MRVPNILAGALLVVLGALIAAPSGRLEAQSAGASDGPGPVAVIGSQVELGRLLFWDPILSGDRDVACATCHHPDFAYADGRDLSLGVGAVGLGPERVDRSGGQIPVVLRNSQTVLNTAFNGASDRRFRGRGGRGRGGGRRPAAPLFDGTVASVNQATAPMFWDNRVQSLERQALEPIKSLQEMRGHSYSEEVALDRVVERLREIPEYVRLFQAVFGPETTIDADQLGQAIAAFERTLVALDSPFDRFQAGDRGALDAQQQRGLETFNDVGCDRCHDGPMFSDFSMHAEGVAEHPALAVADEGAGRFRFRTPTLRNVTLTAPYMHNGTQATLEDVLRFYNDGQSENPNVTNGRGRRGGGGGAQLDQNFRRVDAMSDGQMQDIIAFLGALTDSDFDRQIPVRVPSGLPAGGRLTGQ